MRTHKHSHRGLLIAGILGALPIATSLAQDAPTPAVVKPLLTETVTGVRGKEVTMSTVEYLPGGESLPHRHDAEVFVYVLEGSVVMQVDGKEPVTLLPGQTFHERPSDIHRVSKNASATEPAKFLVFMLKDKGKPATRAADDKR